MRAHRLVRAFSNPIVLGMEPVNSFENRDLQTGRTTTEVNAARVKQSFSCNAATVTAREPHQDSSPKFNAGPVRTAPPNALDCPKILGRCPTASFRRGI
jgi:hypothetical protein